MSLEAAIFVIRAGGPFSRARLALYFAMDLSRVWHLVAVFCLTYVLIKIIQLHRRRQVLLKALNNYAGPPPHWLYGHVREFSSVSEVYRKVEKWSCLYPFAFPLWFGRFTACLNITHPDYAKTILARTEPKDNFGYRNIIPWIGMYIPVLHDEEQLIS
ncbi:hypothetical protein Chor_003684 [Crotalus horridus]